MAPARWKVLAISVLLAACTGATANPAPAPEAASSPAPPPVTYAVATQPDRLPAVEAGALVQLAAQSPPIDPSVDVHHPDPVALVSSLPAEQQALFDTEIRAAVDAAASFPTTDAAAAAGYTQSSTQLPGIGTHWVKWSLVDQPFDPAQPAMLLFDESPLHPPRLAGFSYWVRSTGPPDGFAGPNDVWHRHSGLCFDNGFLVREDVAAADQCPGQWLNGSDLWMLHAWVAPGLPNAAGLFAARNNTLCLPYWQQVPDLLKCGGDAGEHGSADVLLPDGSVYCHLPTT